MIVPKPTPVNPYEMQMLKTNRFASKTAERCFLMNLDRPATKRRDSISVTDSNGPDRGTKGQEKGKGV